MLRWQTEYFPQIEVRRTAGTVWLAPTTVVEIAIDGVQRSSRYPGGIALRFARVKRYRDDKPASEADTIQTLREMLRGGRGCVAPARRRIVHDGFAAPAGAFAAATGVA